MATINKLDNAASIVYDGTTFTSNTVTTLLLPPTIVKAVDKPTANVGETLTYTVTVTNISLSPITDLPFLDVLPAGALYLQDSFTVNGTPATPVVSGGQLTYTIPSIPAAGAAVLAFQVLATGE